MNTRHNNWRTGPARAIYLVLLLACARPAQPPLTIAVAANMHAAARVLADTFTARTGIACALVAGSSGGLTAQIREGAPFDLFLSADMRYPAALHAEGFAADSPRACARGRLVLWTARPGAEPSWEWLASDSVRHIAIANPRNAPYGAAALEALKAKGLQERLAGRLVQGESAAQAAQFVLSGAAEAGFTALSLVQSPELQGIGRWTEVDSALYAPILQGVLVLNRNPAPARQFQAFLFSPEARAMLGSFGYWAGK
ncbi:MAG: molybdate ABC transporter substrate-binding protein [Bacteroidia bacterium]|nr:molybdate ABC transporter substrate-binding protein [Bacteroidia bacterium]